MQIRPEELHPCHYSRLTLTPEMRAKVEIILKQHHIGSLEFRHGMNMKTNWETEFGERVGMLRLKGPVTPTQDIGRQNLQDFLNKPTTFYWAQSAQDHWENPRRDTCHLWPFACIYKEWFRYYNRDPDYNFGHFFANPVQITSTGPTNITDICEAHRLLCDRASSFLNMVRRGEVAKANQDPFVMSYPGCYNLYPLCRAILVIFDTISPRPSRNISLDTEAQRQNVVLVRTNDEAGLSAPITFDSIRSQSFPLARSDVDTERINDVVRVSLKTAVHFILDLQQREEKAFPNLHPRKSDKFLLADVKAAELMHEADEKGIDNAYHVKLAIREVEEGNPYEYEEFGFWSPHWN